MNKSNFLDLMSPFTTVDIDTYATSNGGVKVEFKVIFGEHRLSLSETYTLEEIENMSEEAARKKRKLLLAPILQGWIEKLKC